MIIDVTGQDIEKGDKVKMINDASGMIYVIKNFGENEFGTFVRIKLWARPYDKGFYVSSDEIRKY